MEKPLSDSLDHMAILRGIARRHKRLVVGIFFGLAIPLLAMVYFTSRPLYVSTATIAIESSPLEQLPFFREVPRRDTIATQLALLKSRSLTEGVIEALPKESLEELLTNTQRTDLVLALGNMLKRWLGKPPMVLSPRQRALAELQNARMEFIESREAGSILNIKATASNPRVAMDLVNTHIQVLLSRTRSANQEEARKAREFLEVQTQQVKEGLTGAEETLAKFEQQKGRIRLGAQTELDLVRLSQTENALAEAQASREVLSARIAALRGSLDQARAREPRRETESQGQNSGRASAGPAGADAVARFNVFKAAQERLTALEAKLAAMRERYTEAHPLVQVTQEEVAKEQARVAQLAREVPVALPPPDVRGPSATPAAPSERAEAQQQLAALETEEAALQTKVETLKIQVDRLRKNVRTLSQEEVEFSNLRRTVEANRNLLTVLSDKLMAARIREQGETSVIRIIDPASFPLQPTQSKTQQLALMVLALAGGIAFGAAFGIEIWRQPVETDSDVRKVTGLPVLGYVGVMGGDTPSPLPVHLPHAPVAAGIHLELYRAIRATVETERLKTPFRSILVTSPGPHEGKSTTVLNLAHVFQEFGRRVLVVEADLRRPVLVGTLSLENKPGLVDFLNGLATFEEICHTLPSGVTVIPSQVAQKDAGSMLASSRLKELLDQANARYDLVLVDSPPVLAVPDNLLLVVALHRVILVVKANGTRKRDLVNAQAALRQANAQILGVILNQANPADIHYYHHRYRKYFTRSDDNTIAAQPPRGAAPLAWLGKWHLPGRSTVSAAVALLSARAAGRGWRGGGGRNSVRRLASSIVQWFLWVGRLVKAAVAQK